MYKIACSIFLIIASPLLSFAQEGGTWSLIQCVDYAKEHNLDLKANQLNIKSQQETVTENKHAQLPDLNFSTGLNFNQGYLIDPVSNEVVLSSGVFNQNIGINSSVNLYQGGRIQKTIKKSFIDQEKLESDLTLTEYNITLQVIRGYIQILFNHELLAVAKRNIKNTQEQISQTNILVEGGTLPRTNLYDLHSQEASDEQNVVQAENNLAISILDLKQLLNLKDDDDFAVKYPAVPDPDESILQVSSTDLYFTAVELHPMITSSNLSIQSSMLNEKIAQSYRLPTLRLNAGYSTGYTSSNTRFDYFQQLDITRALYAGLSLNVPIYNKYQVKGGINRAKINTQIMENQLNTSKNELRQTIERAFLDVKSASKSFHANEKRVHALEESFRVTKERYTEGAANATEFNIAKNNLVSAQSDLLRMKYDYVFKLKILEFYTGEDIQF